MLIFKIQGIQWDLSLMRISYNLTKRTKKAEKIENSLKMFQMYIVINFKTIRYKLTASGKTIHSIFN